MCSWDTGCSNPGVIDMSNGFCLDGSRLYREKNRERINRNNQNWKKRNRERYLKQKQEYYQRHKEQYQEYIARRKSLEKYTRDAAKVSYLSILARDGYWYYLCEKDVMPEEVSYDHVIPLSRGGTHTENNIRITHLSCNLSKNNRLLEELKVAIN